MRNLTGTLGAALIFALAGVSGAYADNTGLESIHVLKKEGKVLCMDGHFHYGQGHSQKTKREAEKAAVLDWANLVALEYGTDWWSWRIAANRSMKCERTGGIYHCYAEGRPCRPPERTGK